MSAGWAGSTRRMRPIATTDTRRGPARLRVPLPTSGRWPRAGKIRLGTAALNEAKTAELGREIFTPKKADHFVVHKDDSGITTAEAADAFQARYGDEPRQLRFMLVGDTPEENMEGAYRLYGQNKLKIRCDGEQCSERSQTGAWVEKPCICNAKNLPPESRERCTLTYTIQLVLPDVAIPGVWQLDTGSEISSRRMADWLDMIYTLRGGLRGIEGDLFLVPVSVQPEGRQQTSTVYVLSPQAREATVQQLLAGGGAVELGPGARAELPAPAADEVPEPTLDRTNLSEESRPDASPGATAAHRGSDGIAQPSDTPGGTEPPSIAQQIRSLGDADKARLRARSQGWDTKQTISGVAAYIEANYPGETRVVALLDQLDALEASSRDEDIPF
jgi:hypothetical protein